MGLSHLGEKVHKGGAAMQGYLCLFTSRGEAAAKEPIQGGLVFCEFEAFSTIRARLATGAQRKMKLQAIIDAAFSVRDAQRAPQARSVPFRAREQLFQHQATKIETPRAARLANPGKLLTDAFVFEVVRHRGYWRTMHGGKRSAPQALGTICRPSGCNPSR